jgi:flavin reductase (DIM6/NTAB) family NADH-FMN oxidoreductase RutF
MDDLQLARQPSHALERAVNSPGIITGEEMDEKSTWSERFSVPYAHGAGRHTSEGRANFMAVAWVTRVNGNPPMMAVTPTSATTLDWHPRANLSINIPSVDLMARTDYCICVAERQTSRIFDLFYGDLGSAPMIKECPLNIECRLVDVITLPSHYLCIGQVMAVFADQDCLTAGKPDIEKIRPFVLTMPDNNYWAIGQHLGKAWSIGREFKR